MNNPLKRPALGRGLTSLMSQMAPEDATQRELPLGSLVPNRAQPRTHFDETALAELAESLKQHGMVQPIVVRKVGDQFELEEGDAQSYLDDGVIEGPVEVPAGDNTTVTTVKPGATASKPRAPAARKK